MIAYIKQNYVRAEENFPRIMKLGRFIISGGCGAATNIGCLFLFTHVFHIWYIASSIIAFLIAFCVSFVFQKFWTFKNSGTQEVHIQASFYLVTTLINLALNTGLLYLLVEKFSFHYLPAQVVASIVIAFESYFVYRVIFRQSTVEKVNPA